MKFTAIQGNLDTYMYYFRLLVVNLGTYYIFSYIYKFICKCSNKQFNWNNDYLVIIDSVI